MNDKIPTGRYVDNVVPASREELRELERVFVDAKPVASMAELIARLKTGG